MAKYAECVHGRNSAFCVMGCDPIPIPEKSKPAKKASLARPRKAAEVVAAVTAAEGLAVAEKPAPAPKPVRTHVPEPETEQMVLNDICDVLGTPRRPLKAGVPVQVLQVASGRLGLGYKVTTETSEKIVRKAGLTWDPAFLYVDELAGTAPVLTIDGARALRSALATLLG
ncbi:hypothetical protein [Nocardioides sp.]|uniref:hypothetical protein n=1 Tax=Nocardioides sp. TaxID=35761 RepID=UPI0026156762|nr:hypothetical protein [Nocardioides sp.]